MEALDEVVRVEEEMHDGHVDGEWKYCRIIEISRKLMLFNKIYTLTTKSKSDKFI